MATHFLFCPGFSDYKKQKTKSNKKRFSFKSTSPVDPLYETIPIQAKYSEKNRGRHTFDNTGRWPSNLQHTARQAATVVFSHSPDSSSQSQQLNVVTGDTVQVLHQDHGWSYVVDKMNRMGYVPSGVLREEDSSINSTVTPFGSENLITNPSPGPETSADGGYSNVNSQRRQRSSTPRSSTSNRILAPLQSCDSFHNSFTTFTKSPRGIRTLLYSYMPAQENDLTVRKGEQVTVLNSSDQDWLWVVRGDGEEGFLPASYTVPAATYSCGNGSIASQTKHSRLTKQHSYSTGYRSSSSVTNSNNQLSAAFSDQLRVTPVRSLPHSPVNLDASCYLQASSEPTVDKHRSSRHRRSPERAPSRESRSKTPDILSQKRANSLEYIDKKHRNAISPSPHNSDIQRKAHTTARQYNQPVQRPSRPAPSPPEECHYQNLNLVYPNPVHPLFISQAGPHENIYMNTLELDANGKPSLVPSIMTMHDRIQLLDRNPVPFPHSTSENSLAHTSSLGDINSVSEFNQYYMNNRILKEDMV